MKTFGAISICQKDRPMWMLADVEPHVCIRLKDLFKSIHRSETSPFFVVATPETAEDLRWFFIRFPFRVPADVAAELDRLASLYRRQRDELENIFSGGYQPPLVTFKEGKALRPYQHQAVELHNRVRRYLLADTVGLGKTVSAIGTFANTDALPALVVVQTHLAFQWRDEIEKYTDLRTHVIKGRKPYPLPVADIYIMKYSLVTGWVDYFSNSSSPIRSVVFDEIQELRREESAKHQASRKISERVDYCLGLSATPVYNYGDESFNILDLIKPGCLDKKWEFLREWCGGGNREVSNPKALGSYLRSNFLMLRRTRKDVAMELPEVNKIVHTVDYDEAAIEDMERTAKLLAIRVMQGSFIERGQAARELDMMVRHATGVSKAPFVAEYVRILLESGEPVLLVGWHRDVYEIWLKELAEFKPVLYTGSESQVEKEKSRKDFMSGKTDLMIMSLRSGVGLNGLQDRCSYVVFGELDWSPGVHEQVTGRLNRDGQKNQVTSIYLVSNSGSDPLIVDLLGLKSSQASGIFDPFASVESQHSDDSRIRLLAQRFIDSKEVLNA
jgi:SNF2 family DNA or RNA helicase